jgi:TonB-dependent SusC/RagA subfamily outer membrane receptor
MYMYKKILTLSVAIATFLFANVSELYAQAGAEKFRIEGNVVNAATKKPIRGIRVTYKNIAAAITDSAGNFDINLPVKNGLLLLEGEGYQAKEIPVTGLTKLKVVMYDDNFSSSSEVVLLPTAAVTKTLTPYAAASVSVNDGWSRYGETPDGYLQGKVAGLNVIRRSGTANIGAAFFLRGINSLYATNQPLIIVDGVIFDNSSVSGSIISNNYNNPLSSIDVRDIDNISVLKDASSLYGTKGGNGAIIITTIRAVQLGTKIDFAVNGGFNAIPQNLPVMNAADYRVYLSEILKMLKYKLSHI